MKINENVNDDTHCSKAKMCKFGKNVSPSYNLSNKPDKDINEYIPQLNRVFKIPRFSEKPHSYFILPGSKTFFKHRLTN